MELWDAYDRDFHKIEGVTLIRGESVPEGMLHLVCKVLVRHRDGTYLLTQRDPRKHRGGSWEATVGGSALQGEGPMECAIRELREETGIEVGIQTDNLVPLGMLAEEPIHCIFAAFLCVTDWDKEKITLQEGETVDFRWVSREELQYLRDHELASETILNFPMD